MSSSVTGTTEIYDDLFTHLATPSMRPIFCLPDPSCGNGTIRQIDLTDATPTQTRRRLTHPLARRPAVHRATSLAAERPHLKLVARSEIAAAVAALDKRLDPPAPDAYSSPIQVGTVERFIDPYVGDKAAWRYHGIGGKDIIVIVPIEADSDDTDAAVRLCVRSILAHLEPR